MKYGPQATRAALLALKAALGISYGELASVHQHRHSGASIRNQLHGRTRISPYDVTCLLECFMDLMAGDDSVDGLCNENQTWHDPVNRIDPGKGYRCRDCGAVLPVGDA